ncbi:large ribosomal subunit protein mL55 [Latimeria chalumnae]|uniref:Mitochondrial ribosomal protein L55 n=1 Tax=Latimeria chalumnae TaxID=7897 RepID=H3B9B9_LATCH|nr:PREDICTED: 39S ribosomal protein L55, mitochondrial [Latimeria chalumnae]|eukprot:XP_005991188.1 PREDICTED: 39S ribosomal protein L55, mitochondrial [Latimeria chalumnae]
MAGLLGTEALRWAYSCLRHSGIGRMLPAACCLHSTPARHNSNRTSVVRCGRQTHARMYPVLLVRPDGSTIKIQYKEPKRILMMPVDISTLTEEERKARLRKRDLKKTSAREEKDEFEDDFDMDKYSKFWKKK